MATWLVDSTAPGGTSTGSITGNVLTLSAFAGTLPVVGNLLTGAGITVGTTITGITTPWNGTTGVYATSATGNVASESITIGRSGTTANGWNNALVTAAAAIALAVAGDDFNLATSHAETQAASVTLAFPGTVASPNRIFSCGKTNAPAQGSDVAVGASIAVTGAFNLTVSGEFYMYGVALTSGSGASTTTLTVTTAAGGHTILEACPLKLNSSSASSTISFSGNATNGGKVELINCVMTFGSASQSVSGNNGVLIWRNTASALGGATIPTTLFKDGSRAVVVRLLGIDLSAAGSGKTLFGAAAVTRLAQLSNCRFGGSVVISATPTTPGSRCEVVGPGTAASPRMEVYDYEGTLVAESTIIRSGGASNTWKLVTTANANRQRPFACFEEVYQLAAGSPVTIDLNTITDLNSDATALTNADVWIEAQVMDQAGFATTTLYSSAPANLLTAGATMTSGASSGAWTTTGMTTPDARSATLTFTPQTAGYVRVTIKVGRASLTTLRVDPEIRV